ncbi:polymer-forming cytoskeletal protein [Oceanicola sp. D3]|uniref:bactofilin family protein n=1 Tax=Oceanicola sp. D3 TaxID=2587163 RepID=UPI0011227D68|nr:polymer-forming cytoskeletal protein [Oceanicola sp. D3]QDC09220.1 polymer-forming cytoskeletal protein [Oceanicola sp. D3]
MFSKSRINEPGSGASAEPGKSTTADSSGSSKQPTTPPSSAPASGSSSAGSSTPKAKPPASTLSSDLTIVGNIKTTGDIQIEGTVEGDIRAHLLTVGEGATVRGECLADDVVVNGRVVGRVRGLKVRLTSTARVEGDIIHKTIAIESGAHFEGSVQRQDDPLASGTNAAPKPLPTPEAKAQG